jgi:magnesium-transporting ATPase (P-type)
MPLLYYVGQEKRLFTTGIFVSWLIQGVVHGAIIFFGVFFVFDREIMLKDGS